MALKDRFKELEEVVQQKSEHETMEQIEAHKVVKDKIEFGSVCEEISALLSKKVASIPIWFEYSESEQKKLLGEYMTKKLSDDYPTLSVSEEEKENLISIFTSSVHGFGALDYYIARDDVKAILVYADGTVLVDGGESFHKEKSAISQAEFEKIYARLSDGANKNNLNLFRIRLNKTVITLFAPPVSEKKILFEKRIRRAFSRFVPEQIIDSLVKQADDTDQKVGVGETRSVAILFSDIRSFTNISEKNRADVLVSFLNRYFSTMVEIIKKHGGTIDKFIGDAIMAEFGTPVSYEDNCRRAVMAAYEMRDALPSVEMGDLVMPDGMVFNIGIGIHYGEVIVGSIGSKDKTDYSVIGDNVNLASRLEGLTKTYGTQILVSESVRADAGEDSFCFRHLDDVRVKGKKNAVPIYAVDRSPDEFPSEYKNAYIKGMELYKQGIWNLAKDYFVKALQAVANDKAAKLMLERCEDFIKNPPENWDGAIALTSK